MDSFGAFVLSEVDTQNQVSNDLGSLLSNDDLSALSMLANTEGESEEDDSFAVDVAGQVEEPEEEHTDPEPEQHTNESDPNARLNELQSKYDAQEPLTTEERKELHDLQDAQRVEQERQQQAERDRQEAVRKAREQGQKVRDGLSQQASGLIGDIVDSISRRIGLDTGSPSAELLQREIQDAVISRWNQSEPLALLIPEARIRTALQERGHNPDDMPLDEKGPTQGLIDLITYGFDAEFKRGQGDTTASKKVAELEGEVSRLKKELEDQTSRRGRSGQPAAGGNDGNGRSSQSLEALIASGNIAELKRRERSGDLKVNVSF